jgi:hypothetical protein
MTVTRERFEEGMTAGEYRAQMTMNRERFEENERTLELNGDDVAFFAQLEQPLHVLALAEDWCGDVINNLPVLFKLAEVSDKLNVRVFLRDKNLDIMDQYLNKGEHRSIPVFVFFDEDFREIGHWIERPALMSEIMGKHIAELFATAPELAGIAPGTSPAQMPEAARAVLQQNFIKFRAEHRVTSDNEVVRELRELVSK